ERFRSYQPLSEEEKEAMSDKQIELWEEKAKSGLLRGESTIRDGMYALRGSLQGRVDGDGPFNMLSSIGISTTANYLDGGKLEIDEDKLREALTENPEGVYDLFVNNSKGDDRGLIHRFDDALDRTRGQIERKAGKSTATLDNYAIGKEIKQLNSRISDFERKMVRVEERYWNQFTAMEKAISNLNQQSESLFSQFGM
ncbi:MAG TPA: flagellar filament capping protein FliD, partial [Pseudogracilibacillus sp.]|nr:flagellar filament capping protein FliD [Pseudogracilibacillus sp.]